MDKSAKVRLKSIGNTVTVRKNPPENREQLQKFPLNLKFLYATRPRVLRLPGQWVVARRDSGGNGKKIYFFIVSSL